jgi:hypothetical protein
MFAHGPSEGGGYARCAYSSRRKEAAKNSHCSGNDSHYCLDQLAESRYPPHLFSSVFSGIFNPVGMRAAMRRASILDAWVGWVAVATVWTVFNHTASYGQELQWLRDDVRRPPAPPQATEETPPASSPAYDRTDFSSDPWDTTSGDAVLLLLGVGVIAAASPFWGPVFLVADDYSCQGYFPVHPYEEHLPGYMMIEPVVPVTYYTWATRVSAEYAGDFDSQTRLGGHILAETTFRLGIDTEFNHRREELPVGHDSLWTGDANLVFRFAQSEHWQFRSGLGFNWMDDGADSDFGWNFTYGADWYPAEPFIFSATLDWGQLGSSHVLHLRGTVGLEFHSVELYTGYDYYDVADHQYNGFIGGVRIWF